MTTTNPPAISTSFPKYRVACDERTLEPAASEAAAERQLTAIEKLDECKELHRVEVLADGEWLPRHVAIAARIMSARVSDPPQAVELPDGPLKVVGGGWSDETSDRIEAAGIGSPEFCALIDTTPYDREVILTADGRQPTTWQWCSCAPERPMETWVRYERWTPRGRAGHGYVCPACRRLVQSG
jgi:hypothetical protein